MPECSWRRVLLGEVATVDIDRVSVETGCTYPVAGVYSEGKGLFARGELAAAETGYRELFRLRAGQLVMRKLTAWEGPVAVVPPAFDGFFASPEFPTFTLQSEQVEPGFVSVLCRQPTFWAALADRATGSVQRRRRVSPQRLLDVPILLPPRAEQRRLAALFDACDAATAAATEVGRSAEGVRTAMREELLGQQEYELVPLGEVVDIPSKLVDPGAQPYASMPHVGVDRMESWTGRVLPLRTAQEDEVTSGKHVFAPGDIVYAKIRPALAKVALLDIDGLCSADAYPLRVRPGVDAAYLVEALLTRRFVEQAVARSGRTKMPKINRSELFRLPVPMPDYDEQRRLASLLGAAGAQGTAAARYADVSRRLFRELGESLLAGGASTQGGSET